MEYSYLGTSKGKRRLVSFIQFEALIGTVENEAPNNFCVSAMDSSIQRSPVIQVRHVGASSLFKKYFHAWQVTFGGRTVERGVSVLVRARNRSTMLKENLQCILIAVMRC